jgi:hypothetical protein
MNRLRLYLLILLSANVTFAFLSLAIAYVNIDDPCQRENDKWGFFLGLNWWIRIFSYEKIIFTVFLILSSNFCLSESMFLFVILDSILMILWFPYGIGELSVGNNNCVSSGSPLSVIAIIDLMYSFVLSLSQVAFFPRERDSSAYTSIV